MEDVWTYRDEFVGDIDLTGFSVEAIDGSIGKVDEATFDVGASSIVVDTGPWILGKKTVLPAGVIDRIDAESETVFLACTKDEVKNAPEFGETRYADDEFRGRIGTYYEGLGTYRTSRR
jgi:hypothetical protein